MTPIDTRLAAFVDSERSNVAAEYASAPEEPVIRAAHDRAHQIDRARRRRRTASLAMAGLAVLVVGTVSLWTTRSDDGSMVTVGLPDPGQRENPAGPQTGPEAPSSAFAHDGRVRNGEPAAISFEPGEPIARTGFNDRQLVVTIIGGEPRLSDDDPNPCGVDYVGSARLDADRFVVRLDPVVSTSGPEKVLCGSAGTRTAVINLPEPLDGRSVVDEAGTAIRVVDASSFLLPRVVPDGWSARSESIYADPTAAETNFRWTQYWSDVDPSDPDASTAGAIRVEEVETAGAETRVAADLRVRPGKAPEAPIEGRVVDNRGVPMTAVGTTTVRGRTTLLFDYLGDLHTLTVIWEEGTRVHALTADSSATSGITPADLVAMAQSMTTATGH